MLDINFWQGRYDSHNTPWDLGAASPHFVALLQNPPAWLKAGKMAVPGCGRGHDAALFGRAGFDVTGFDYAPGAILEGHDLYGDCVSFQQANFFDLANPASPWAGQFDYLLEHTCFCAIHPKERPAYVQSAKNLLKPGGIIIGVFWEHNDPDGPPFSTSEAQLQQAFEADFEIVSQQDLPPASNREGVERLVILRRLSEV